MYLTYLVLAATTVVLPPLPARDEKSISKEEWVNYTRTVLRQIMPDQGNIIATLEIQFVGSPEGVGTASSGWNPDTDEMMMVFSPIAVIGASTPEEYAFVAIHELAHLAIRHRRGDQTTTVSEREEEADLTAALAINGGSCSALNFLNNTSPPAWLLEKMTAGELPPDAYDRMMARRERFRDWCEQGNSSLRVALLKRVLADTPSIGQAEAWSADLADTDPSVLVRLDRLARLRKESTDTRYNRVNGEYLQYWMYLVKHDAPVEVLIQVDEPTLGPLVTAFKDGRLNPAVIPSMTEIPSVK